MTTADDTKAKALVLDLLKDKAVGKIKLHNGKILLDPSMYEKVGKAIGAGDIKVVVEPKWLPADTSGLYVPEVKIDDDNIFYDLLVLRRPDLGDGVNEQFHAAATIIHECTHAGFDMLKIESMTHLEHEAGSYIAGAIFMVSKMVILRADPEKVTPTEPIEAAAWAIALTVAGGKAVLKQAYNDLNVAISTNPQYKADAKKILVNDGVGRKWRIKGKDV